MRQTSPLASIYTVAGYLDAMPFVYPDIQAIADRDPVMRELHGHQACLLYKDWRLFRDRKLAELARRLEQRMQRRFREMAERFKAQT
jgi:hypothetical protein